MSNLALKIDDDATLSEDILTRRYRTGEERLMQAVLADAIEVYCAGPFAGARRLFAETAAWFADDADPSPFSFRNVCDALGFDPASIRARLGLPRHGATREGPSRRPLECVVAH